jgi:hypothetical protein
MIEGEEMKNVDAGDFASIAGPLFAQEASGPELKEYATTAERVVAEIISQHQGRGNPISIAKLGACTGKSEREIKGIVEQLVVTHRMKIGGRRGDPAGYFVVVDADDLEMAVRPYRDQIFAMLRRLRVLMAPLAYRELKGQLVIDSEEERKGC